jgi:hypothetical protein
MTVRWNHRVGLVLAGAATIVASSGFVASAEAQPAATTTTPAPPAPTDRIRPRPEGARMGATIIDPTGSPVVVSGTGCITDGQPGEAVVAIGISPQPSYGGATVSADANGDWQVDVGLLPSVVPGTYTVRAGCLDVPVTDTGYLYDPTTITVTAPPVRPAPPGTPAAATESPAPAPPARPALPVRAQPRFTG